MDEADQIIAELGLSPHREGGWFRETWRATAARGERSGGTAILFLLKAGERSHWHRVDADETWLWHAGAPLVLRRAAADDAVATSLLLGGDVLNAQSPQALVPAGHWQAAEAAHGWALVSCVVVPGFDFAGFELAASGWAPGQ